MAGYCALALVPLATMFAALSSAWWVGKRAAKSGLNSTRPVLIAGLLVFAFASVIRVYPLPELTFQLPTYLDASPGLSRLFDDLKRAELPVLGQNLGGALTLVYLLVEALVLVGAVFLVSRRSIRAPFCYSCKQYCRREIGVARFLIAPMVQVVTHAQGRDWSFFRNLGAPRGADLEWLRVDTASCPQCSRTNTLSIQLMTRDGTRKATWVHDIAMTQDDMRTVSGLAMSHSASTGARPTNQPYPGY